MKSRPVLERMRDKTKVDPVTGRWLWTGAVSNGHGKWEHLSGYGYVRDDAEHGHKVALVHRVSYRELVGPIPDGHEVDHTCVRRLCWNPDHLQAVTPERNKELQAERRAAVELAEGDIPL